MSDPLIISLVSSDEDEPIRVADGQTRGNSRTAGGTAECDTQPARALERTLTETSLGTSTHLDTGRKVGSKDQSARPGRSSRKRLKPRKLFQSGRDEDAEPGSDHAGDQVNVQVDSQASPTLAGEGQSVQRLQQRPQG